MARFESFWKPCRNAKHNKTRAFYSSPLLQILWIALKLSLCVSFIVLQKTNTNSNSRQTDTLFLVVQAEWMFVVLAWEAAGGGHAEEQISGLLHGGWQTGRQGRMWTTAVWRLPVNTAHHTAAAAGPSVSIKYPCIFKLLALLHRCFGSNSPGGSSTLLAARST